MDLIRIGDKLISLSRIENSLQEMLDLRQQGISQTEVAKRFDIDRTFLSRLESLGEIRKGRTIALVGFPVKNIAKLKQVALHEGVDFTLLMTDKERWDFVYEKSGIELLNEIMGLLYQVRQYDVVIILGSDQRLRLFKALLDNEVISINIGKSPITQDVYVDPENLRDVIKTVKEVIDMKHVLSVSIGSSKRNHKVEMEILGEDFLIERVGTDGDIKRAIHIIEEKDGKVSAFGMGGIDLYLCINNKRYTIKDALTIARAAKISPIVDGSGLKNTLERKVIDYLISQEIIDFKNKKVLLVSGMDRFGMAESLEKTGCDLVLGDLIFALGVPIPLKSLKSLNVVASILAPIVCKLPFRLIYPTGEKQEENTKPKFNRFYDEADVIAGDFHFIKRHMPSEIAGKIILTNTVTSNDVKILSKKGAKMLITTTPKLNGRSFGTNVMEGVLVSLSKKPYRSLTAKDYDKLLDRIGFIPRVEILN